MSLKPPRKRSIKKGVPAQQWRGDANINHQIGWKQTDSVSEGPRLAREKRFVPTNRATMISRSLKTGKPLQNKKEKKKGTFLSIDRPD